MRMRAWSVTTWLIVLNVGIFVLDSILMRAGGDPPLAQWGYFSRAMAIDDLELWRFVTCQFVHIDVWHLVVNMLSLYFFGPMVEAYLRGGRYVAFYLLCGAAGAGLYLLLSTTNILVNNPFVPLVGASGAIFGILMAGAHIAPHTTVMLLFPPMPVQLRVLAYALVGIGALVVIRHGPNAGGQAAHLGGAILGFILIRNTRWLRWPWSRRGPYMRYRP